jgi:hypothetical protein
MRKYLILSLLAIVFALSASAQSFFKALPKPGGKLSLGATETTVVVNSIRPVVSVTALLSDGTQLAGGFGAGWQHNVWDPASQTYNTQYSLSAIGFLGSNGQTATFSAGLVVGLLNFISAGPIYDFTTKKFGVATGVQLHFN